LDEVQMNQRLSQRIRALAPSATLAVTARAKALREQGVQVINFGVGEPDFDTPAHIKEAAIRALQAGDTKYPTPVAGKNPLREAIRRYLLNTCGLDYALNQVHVSVGAKDAILQALSVLVDPGDEVIVPAPYWVSYPEQTGWVGGRAQIIDCRATAGRIRPEQLRAALTPATRVLILNSPSNPTGAMYSRAELEELADVLRDTDVYILSDELYHMLLIADQPPVSMAALPGMFERTITINGFSKTYAMTGWRIGYAAGPAPVIEAMSRMQGQTTSGAVSFVQTAAIAALEGPQECVAQMCAEYRRRAARMYERLLEIPGVRCERPRGGFVMLANVAALFGRLGVRSADELATAALEQAHVALVTGSAFGCSESIRLSFATSMDQIEEGMKRLQQMLG
jgi:aspartate aminotransferase